MAIKLLAKATKIDLLACRRQLLQFGWIDNMAFDPGTEQITGKTNWPSQNCWASEFKGQGGSDATRILDFSF
jgi:hypothetical protein